MDSTISTAQQNLNQLLTTPNINTSYLNQIHKSNNLIQTQHDQLMKLSQGPLGLIQSRYEKIMDKVERKSTTIINRDTRESIKKDQELAEVGVDVESDMFLSIQRIAELCDLRLRALENTVSIIVTNETLRYESSSASLK